MKTALFGLITITLLTTGCATGGLSGPDSPLSDLRALVRDDVGQALTLAKAATDPGAIYRARCYDTLLKAIPAPKSAVAAPEAKGVVSAFELAFELAAKVRAKSDAGLVSEAVQADCGYLVDEVKRFVLRRGSKLVPIPGAGSLGGIIFR